ncbi:MAG: S46 family peptidase [Sorangiineae bacterium]|nr:S46 family peptidase [Polyangiaceae bacterium]MEB2321948.1 S46 family peptidase [Sorangiineae bacterium]
MRRSVLGLLGVVACSPAPLDIVPAPPPPPPAASAPVRTAAEAPPAGFHDPGGMWLPSQLVEQAATLREGGLTLAPATLAEPSAAPLAAVVSLGGCSASFVSADGLIATNHHCVTGALQYNSKPGEDLLKDGYLAKTRDEEKSIGPSGRVFVTRAFTDVTATIRGGLDAIADDAARDRAIEARTKELVAGCEAAHPDARCEVADFFGGSEYRLIERLELKDVRLVYAPASGIGNFGGEVDNWRWPRHSGDFAFYRAYVAPDGQPAAFSPKNVPYRPSAHLRVADRPLAAGDFVFVAGYPGRTYRLSTADEVREAVDWYYPRRIALCEDYLAVLGALGEKDEDARLKSTPLSRGLSNVLTYTRGALEGLVKGGAEAVRTRRDEELAAFIDGDARRKQRDGDVLTGLRAVFAERARTRDADAALDELVRFVSLVGEAVAIVHNAEERAKPDAERDLGYQQRDQEGLVARQENVTRRYSRALDAAVLGAALRRAARLPEVVRRPLLAPFVGAEPNPSDAALAAAAGRVLAKTALESPATRVRLMKSATVAQLRASPDPLLKVALALRALGRAAEDRARARAGKLALLRPRYVAALRELVPGPLAPDANGTLRVTYGSVRGYRPRPDAPVYQPFTVASGVAAKATGTAPFDAPQRLLDAIASHPDVPVDFLSDLDITGGNSGSATLDATGKLVGLAFDGNYEAMASDWLFMPDITRAIHVDIRYVLFVMRYVDHADALLDELGVAKGG